MECPQGMKDVGRVEGSCLFQFLSALRPTVGGLMMNVFRFSPLASTTNGKGVRG